MSFENAEAGQMFYVPDEIREVVSRELNIVREAAVEALSPFVIAPAVIIGAAAEQTARFLSKGRGKLTTAFLTLGIALGACSPTSVVSEKPSKLPDGGGQSVEEFTATPQVEATATAKVEPNPMNITEIGAYIRPDVSDELTKAKDLLKTTKDQFLVEQLRVKIKEYQLAVDVENGLMSRVSALPGAETATFANTQLFDLAYKDGEGAQAKIVTAFEMAKQTSKSGNENLAILSWGGEPVDTWLFSETTNGSTNVFFIDKETGKQVVIMQTIEDKPGYMKVFLSDGNELIVQMSLDLSKGGGSKMAAMINENMLLNLEQIDGQWVTDMNGNEYALDLSRHDWVITDEIAPGLTKDGDKFTLTVDGKPVTLGYKDMVFDKDGKWQSVKGGYVFDKKTGTWSVEDVSNNVIESDLHPAYETPMVVETVHGVEIKTKLITDESLAPAITAIKINDHYKNKEGQKSEEALAEFWAQTIYKVWKDTGGPEGKGAQKGETLEDFAKMWAKAQTSGLEADWRKVQIKIKANDMATETYDPKMTTVWPMYKGDAKKAPKDVRVLDEMNLAFVDGAKIKNIVITNSDFNLGYGTNLANNILIVYLGTITEQDFKNVNNLLRPIVSTPEWLITNQKPKQFENSLNDVLANKQGDANSYPAFFQVFPFSDVDSKYNP